MKKSEAIERLHTARSSHIQWRAKVQALAAGLPVEQDQIPVAHTDCKFGEWYYGRGQALNFLPAYRAVEEPHERLHEVYMKLFAVLFGETDTSMLGRLFGARRKQDAKRQGEIDALTADLVAVSRTMLEAMEQLEQDLREVSDDEISGEVGAKPKSRPTLRVVK